MKTCKKCNLELFEESFPIKKTLPDGKRIYRGTCKLCLYIEKQPYTVPLPPDSKVCTTCNNITYKNDLVIGRNLCKSCYNESRRKEGEKLLLKTCSCCNVEKPIEDFRNKRSIKNYIYKHSLCKVCENKKRRDRWIVKKETVTKDDRYYLDLERKREIVKKNSKLTRLKKYNLTEEELVKLETEQNNRCYLCDKEAIYSSFGTLCIDHSHKTNKVRKLLCSACNALLGAANDSPEFLRKCADYIEDFS